MVTVAVAALRRYPRPRAHQSKPEFFLRVVEWEVVPCSISWGAVPVHADTARGERAV
jgi:hypothetical protein